METQYIGDDKLGICNEITVLSQQLSVHWFVDTLFPKAVQKEKTYIHGHINAGSCLLLT
jgi:hypothetical protein